MNLWLLFVVILLIALLVLVRLSNPPAAELNEFELRRRVKLGDAQAIRAQRRGIAAPVLKSIRRIISAGLIFAVFGTAVAAIGLGWAIALTVVLVLLSGYAERPNRFARWSYAKIEDKLLAFTQSAIGKRVPADRHSDRDAAVGSTEELIHIIMHADFLDGAERDSVRAALEFPRLAVRDVMRPRSALATIDKGEVLGPLVIDDLYKTGETTFLVVDGDIDHVHGVLPLDKLTSLELRESPNALKAMDDTVGFMSEDASVAEALRLLRGGSITLIIVQGQNGATAGTVSFNEIINRLFKA